MPDFDQRSHEGRQATLELLNKSGERNFSYAQSLLIAES
jgi:hypothetical protein